jgi:23S rRNA (guanosine2251-2'-O)-methyltransferase
MSARILAGPHAVEEALRAGSPLRYIAMARERHDHRARELAAAARAAGVEVRWETTLALDRLAGGLRHQGVVGVAEAKATAALEDVLAAAPRRLLVAADGIEDPQNLGALMRAAAGAGVDGLLLPARRSAGLTAAVERVSAGALEHVRIARVGNLAQALEQCRDAGWWIVGLDAAAPVAIWQFDLKPPTVVVVGGEGRGLHTLIRARCDVLVRIPLAPGVSSLNAAMAAGIALFEAVRQRQS